ncbi:hypothetical protein SESBI_42158, partial [Sesbania bispinosa]
MSIIYTSDSEAYRRKVSPHILGEKLTGGRVIVDATFTCWAEASSGEVERDIFGLTKKDVASGYIKVPDQLNSQLAKGICFVEILIGDHMLDLMRCLSYVGMMLLKIK